MQVAASIRRNLVKTSMHNTLKKTAVILTVAVIVAFGLLPLAPSLALLVLVPVVIYLIGRMTVQILERRVK